MALPRPVPLLRRRIPALLAALALVLAGLLGHSPEAHDHVHEGSHDEEHACGVTLFQIGFVDSSGAMPRIGAPDRIAAAVFPESRGFAWSAPGFWLLPAQGPPFRA